MRNQSILYADDVTTSADPFEDVFSGLQVARLATVLLMEDDEDLNHALSLRLSSCDFHVVSALDGVDGMERMVRAEPDLVLLDLSMPRLDGYKVLHRIRTEPGMLHTPIVVLTGSSDPDVEAKVGKWDVSRVLRKPASQREIVKTLRSVLSRGW